MFIIKGSVKVRFLCGISVCELIVEIDRACPSLTSERDEYRCKCTLEMLMRNKEGALPRDGCQRLGGECDIVPSDFDYLCQC